MSAVEFTPEEYQLLASDHLHDNPRAALFMGMGLGKTAATLHALLRLRRAGALKGALVVAPLRVAVLTWPDEVAKWAEFRRAFRVANLRTPEGWRALERGTADLYVCNYEMLPKLCNYMATTDDLPFDTVVFDELTKLKNAASTKVQGRKVPVVRGREGRRRIVDIPGLAQWFRRKNTPVEQTAAAVELLGVYLAEVRETGLRDHLPRVKRRWGLTGTPNPNGLMDLFGQIKVLDDGERLGVSESRYREAYFYPTDYMRYNWAPQPDSEERIYAKLSDIALTLRSSDFLGVPDTVFTDVDAPLPATARKDYETLQEELLLVLKGGEEVAAPSAAVLVNRLLQIAGGAIYLEGGKEWRAIHDAKLVALERLVRKLKEPVLIAANYRHERERILKAVKGCVEWNDKILPAWNAGKVPAIVADPRSIGHGLNLQAGGRTVIWYSPTWSRECYDQFNARVARKGQKLRPQVFHILAPGTMDDAVMGALRVKDDGQSALLQALTNFRKLVHAF